MLKEIKNDYEHCFLDVNNRIQGPRKSWASTGALINYSNYEDGELHGESMFWDMYGGILSHKYFYHGNTVHDFILNPLSDIEKMMLVLKYGAPLLPKIHGEPK